MARIPFLLGTAFALTLQAANSVHAAGAVVPERAVKEVFQLFLACPSWGAALDAKTCPMGDGLLTPEPTEPPAPAPKKQAWERALGGPEAARPFIKARLAGWPERLLVEKGTLPQSDAEFAWRVARDTWRGLDALTDRQNGLPIDHVRLATNSGDIAATQIGDYTSGTNIGLYLTAIVGARELRFIAPEAAVEKIRRVLATLEQLERYRGFFFNYYDTTSLERTSHFISFIDSSWLASGLMVARTAFPELSEPCSRLLDQMDFSFFYDPTTQQVSHGYYPNPGRPSRYHYGTFYTEARLGSLIAIGRGEIPEAHWFEMIRTFPAVCAGQSMVPQAVRLKTVRGHEFSAGCYEWKGLRYVPSWGGSMFEALMPTLVLDELAYAPRSLGENGRVHAVVQHRHAVEDLEYRVWGMSPSMSPGGLYGEYGVKILGSRGYEAGPVTPHASALALAVTPEAAIANLRTLSALYDVYGEYGFYDAVDPRSGAVAYAYLALDQSMLFIALANHLADGCVQKRFAADPIVESVLPVISEEDFFD